MHVKTLATGVPDDGIATSAGNQYENLPMTKLREQIITFWWVLLNSTEAEQKEFVDHLDLQDFVEPTDSMKVSEWYNKQTASTKHKLVQFVDLLKS